MTDLISRADAIEIVLTYFIPRSHTGERGEYEEDFARMIFKAIPSAEAVHKPDYSYEADMVRRLKEATQEIVNALLQRDYPIKGGAK